MVSKIDKIIWHRANDRLKSNTAIFDDLPYKLPKIYLELLSIHDGGVIDYNFNYYDVSLKDFVESGLGFIYGIFSPKYNIINEYNDPPEFFPEGLLAFAETGGGDLICFDYRQDSKTQNPAVVYWNHEANEGEDISFVAKDFEEFLSMLEEPYDLD